MGTWAAGPFDNDAAADWCAALDDASPQRRALLVEQALREAVREGDFLDSWPGARAVAASAVVAAHLSGGPPVDSAYAPEFLAAGGRLALSAELPALALRALDRVLADGSELAELWDEAGELDEFAAALAPIRAALADPAPAAVVAG
ncbi:DUF4259 domain-containing protein [Micromonospora sp. C31]|uniref:DUF4259 domain-containing protein n=1 Tax=Micromonospora sp. C31 TaxID=2824876 RepID=UPI001B37A26F|nr:DUF4259 domain-containing protein [Micromonospora sp. C31]MBQ1072963.1 DUF4259 domain-containing protein [Micromonospora sp. C31]